MGRRRFHAAGRRLIASCQDRFRALPWICTRTMRWIGRRRETQRNRVQNANLRRRLGRCERYIGQRKGAVSLPMRRMADGSKAGCFPWHLIERNDHIRAIVVVSAAALDEDIQQMPFRRQAMGEGLRLVQRAPSATTVACRRCRQRRGVLLLEIQKGDGVGCCCHRACFLKICLGYVRFCSILSFYAQKINNNNKNRN